MKNQPMISTMRCIVFLIIIYLTKKKNVLERKEINHKRYDSVSLWESFDVILIFILTHLLDALKRFTRSGELYEFTTLRILKKQQDCSHRL